MPRLIFTPSPLSEQPAREFYGDTLLDATAVMLVTLEANYGWSSHPGGPEAIFEALHGLTVSLAKGDTPLATYADILDWENSFEIEYIAERASARYQSEY